MCIFIKQTNKFNETVHFKKYTIQIPKINGNIVCSVCQMSTKSFHFEYHTIHCYIKF